MHQTTTRHSLQQAVVADNSQIAAVIGLDLGEKRTSLCHLNLAGQAVAQHSLATTATALAKYFRGQPRWRVVLEAGAHSHWIARLIEQHGHEVLTANPRQLKLISESLSKNDRRDARQLAELGLGCPKLLAPIEPRSTQTLTDRCTLVARETLIKARTQMINSVRGMLKIFGLRVPKGESATFPARTREVLPAALKHTIGPLLTTIQTLTQRIRRADKRIRQLGETRYQSTALMRNIPGVGPVTSLAFALALDNDPRRLRSSRDAGAFTGLRPKQRESGSRSPELHISKTGDRLLRRLLVQCAQYILGPFGPQSALRDWGLGLAARGGKSAKKRAIVATARKLAVLLHVLWSRGVDYQPYPAGQPASG